MQGRHIKEKKVYQVIDKRLTTISLWPILPFYAPNLLPPFFPSRKAVSLSLSLSLSLSFFVAFTGHVSAEKEEGSIIGVRWDR